MVLLLIECPKMVYFTGERINELEDGPSSYRLKMKQFGSNRVGFDVVGNFVYKNLDNSNLAAD